jgi:predicted PurR-regulated permease PerM
MDDAVSRWLRALIALGLLVGLFFLMSAIADLVKIVIISALLAYIMDPLAVKLESRGMGRGAATLIIFLFVSAVLSVTFIILLPVLTDQVGAIQTGLSPEQVAVNINKLDELISRKLSFLGIDNIDLAGKVERLLAGFSDWAVSHLLDVVSLVTHMVLIPFMVFFLLKDGRELKRQAVRIIPNRYFEFSMNLISKMDWQLGRYLRGQFLDALIFGILSICALWFLGVKYFLLIGIFAGLANLIPFLGPIAGATPAIVVAIIDTGDLALAGSVILAFVVMKLIDDTLIQPIVVARSVHMHPLLVLLAVIVGGKFFGILGMLLSVPVTGFAKVALQESIENFRRYRLT